LSTRLAAVLLLFACLAASMMGCATGNPNPDSDIPWNAPQPWEGAPGIPGMEAR